MASENNGVEDNKQLPRQPAGPYLGSLLPLQSVGVRQQHYAASQRSALVTLQTPLTLQ